MNSTSEGGRRHRRKVCCENRAGFDVGTTVLTLCQRSPLLPLSWFSGHTGVVLLCYLPHLRSFPEAPLRVSCATGPFSLTLLLAADERLREAHGTQAACLMSSPFCPVGVPEGLRLRTRNLKLLRPAHLLPEICFCSLSSTQ